MLRWLKVQNWILIIWLCLGCSGCLWVDQIAVHHGTLPPVAGRVSQPTPPPTMTVIEIESAPSSMPNSAPQTELRSEQTSPLSTIPPTVSVWNPATPQTPEGTWIHIVPPDYPPFVPPPTATPLPLDAPGG